MGGRRRFCNAIMGCCPGPRLLYNFVVNQLAEHPHAADHLYRQHDDMGCAIFAWPAQDGHGITDHDPNLRCSIDKKPIKPAPCLTYAPQKKNPILQEEFTGALAASEFALQELKCA